MGGHRVGRVTHISFQPVDQHAAPVIDVRMQIPREHQALIRRGSTIRLTSARLIGEPVLDIAPGRSDQPPLEQGDTLYADARPTGRRALDSFHEFKRSLDSLLLATHALQPMLEVRTAQMSHLAVKIQEVQIAFADFKRGLAHGSLDDLLNGASLQQALGSFSQTARRIGPALQAAARQLNDPAVRQSVSRLQHNADSLAATLAQLHKSSLNGSLPRFARDSAISRALHVIQIELDSLVAETRKSPLRFWLGDQKRNDPLQRRW
ncbi:MAG: MlaD family protein [Longimicrobiales bacterium]